jgi:hypothetical protein
MVKEDKKLSQIRITNEQLCMVCFSIISLSNEKQEALMSKKVLGISFGRKMSRVD